VRIDLHTHSDRSDGTLSPAEVVRAAAATGLDVVALTDHDSTVGWAEAATVAAETGTGFVPGAEISCLHAGEGLHLLAYLFDPTHPPLVAALERVVQAREERLPRICAALRGLGIPLRDEDVRAEAASAAAVGRPHVADALVRLGVVANRDEAFDTLLSPGRPAYVPRYAAPVEDVLPLVAAAGGVAVVAHPWGRHGSGALDRDGLADLRDRGLTGVEVDHEDHTPAQRTELRALAAELDLVATGSSDFHGAGKTGHELGCNTTAPEQLQRLLERADTAARAARASGVVPPAVVQP
jgi:predicted metal-dependent phosphoesterase TrpH